MGLFVVTPGHIGLPGQGDLPVGGAGRQAHRGGRIGHIEPGELPGSRVGVVELEPVAVGVGDRVEGRDGGAPVDIDRVSGPRQQGGVEGGDGGVGCAVQAGGPLEPVLVGTAQVTGVEPDGAGPADGDLSGGGRGWSRR